MNPRFSQVQFRSFSSYFEAAKKAKDMDAPVVEASPEDEARWRLSGGSYGLELW